MPLPPSAANSCAANLAAQPVAHFGSDAAPLRFELPFQPPYDWPWVLAFLARRMIAGVEWVGPDDYSRVVRLPTPQGWAIGHIDVRPCPGRAALQITLSHSLAGVQAEVLTRVRRLLDLDCAPDQVNAVLGPLSADAPGVRVPGAFDGFEMAVRGVLGQQVTVKAAHTLAGRLAMRFGDGAGEPQWQGAATPATPATKARASRSTATAPGPHPVPAPLSRAFPDAARLAALPLDELAACGLVRARAAAIQAIARAILDDGLVLAPAAPLEASLAQLKRLRGIGDWTAQYIAMRALSWPDAFPASDLILMRVLGARTPAQASATAQAWRPWRSYAVMHLWRRSASPPALPADRPPGPAPAR